MHMSASDETMKTTVKSQQVWQATDLQIIFTFVQVTMLKWSKWQDVFLDIWVDKTWNTEWGISHNL